MLPDPVIAIPSPPKRLITSPYGAAPGGDRQAGHADPRIGSVRLDEQDRIVADGQCVGLAPGWV